MNIINNVPWVTPNEINLLQNHAARPFNLGGYSSLDDMLTQLGISVIIDPDIIVTDGHPAFDDTLSYWRDEVERLKELYLHHELCFDAYAHAMRIYEELLGEEQYWREMPLRGCYDAQNKVVRLFPNEMQQEYSGNRMNELLVSTLAHEVMHAYFNRPGHESFPYVICVEEPLAEFGMLLYLYDTNSSYYQWSHDDVKNKKTVYRYGAMLMDQCLSEGSPSSTRKYLEGYKVELNYYSVLNNQSGANKLTLPHVWNDVFDYPPRYFYDKSTKTLGLDGNCDGYKHYHGHDNVEVALKLSIHARDVERIYLGAHYHISSPNWSDLICQYPVTVSPLNTEFHSVNGIPVYTKDNKPALDSLGKGLYGICRKGKWGVIDEKLQQIVPFKYDCIWTFDDNGLSMFRRDKLYGLINQQGEEQVPAIYDDISKKRDGCYMVKKDGVEYKIDANGNRL